MCVFKAALQQQALMQADPQLAMQVLWQQHAQQVRRIRICRVP